MTTLYKMTNSGKIQQWDIVVGKDARGDFYKVTHGQVSGKKQVKKTYVHKGKNIGRANETTPAEQCQAEAKALWVKKRDRSGYTSDIPTSKPLLPMLAKTLQEHKNKIKYPGYVQPKLDGIRCLWLGGTLKSRRSSIYNDSLPYLVDELKDTSLILDGELYVHGMPFQKIVSHVKRDDWNNFKDIQFHVYDVLDTEKPFVERLKILQGLPTLEYVKVVPTYTVNSFSDIDAKSVEFVQDNYEGLIFRNADGPYKVNGRSPDLLKYKSFTDQEFKIVDIVPMDKAPTFGKYICEHNGVSFSVTPKCTEDEKAALLVNRTKYLGKDLTVRFFEWTTTENPLPRFPVGIAVRDYE